MNDSNQPMQDAAEVQPGEHPEPARIGASGSARGRRRRGAEFRCTATKVDGSPCTNGGIGSSGRCLAHTDDAGVKAVVAAARARGGAQPRVRLGMTVADDLDLASPEGAVGILAAVVKAVAIGKISASQASAITQAVRTALVAVEMVTSAQLRDLQAQLDAAIEARRGR
jgi:hypothetical protein